MVAAVRNKLIIVAFAAAAASGCMASDPFAPQTDPQSAAAASIAEATARTKPYPKWSDFPAAPTNVPQPSTIATRVAETEAAQAALVAAAAEIEWTLSDTQGWAASARSLVDPSLAVPAPADATAQTEAFAAEARAKATPPPVAK